MTDKPHGLCTFARCEYAQAFGDRCRAHVGVKSEAPAPKRGRHPTRPEYRVGVGEAWCSGCQAPHPVAEFGVDRSRVSGLSALCRAAVKARDASRWARRKDSAHA